MQHMAEAITDIEESVAAERRRTLTNRFRVLAWVTLGIALLFIVMRPKASLEMAGRYAILRWTAVAFVAAFIAGTHRRGFVRHQLVWGILLGSGIAVLGTIGGTLRGDIGVTVSLHIILVLMTAAVLPWGVAAQALIVAICGALLAVSVTTIGAPVPGDPAVPTLVNAFAASLLSLFVAYHTRSSFDQAVRENLHLRAAEARNRALNEELEAKVRARTAELEGALTDQRAVTRAISHDLRQPLRHIHGFTRMFEEEFGDTFSAGHREHLDRVRMATLRMDRMVDALLELSRVSGRPLQRTNFDLSRCARELCEELQAGEPERRVELRIAEGLSEHCDGGLTRTLLQQLLANAWKFTRGRDVGVIEVGQRDGAFFVKDNGPGFDMQYARRLFHAFERLHHPAEFEGEGMGLAIADRIVRRHGGRIWAESEPDHGATFLFTLRAGMAGHDVAEQDVAAASPENAR
ncbi:MAG TPA: ATP-binding protein [Candidatus Limnocylindrales bacterium]|nr:ATP-binding protein [Candidatus Limnocylindrales bacterium]